MNTETSDLAVKCSSLIPRHGCTQDAWLLCTAVFSFQQAGTDTVKIFESFTIVHDGRWEQLC